AAQRSGSSDCSSRLLAGVSLERSRFPVRDVRGLDPSGSSPAAGSTARAPLVVEKDLGDAGGLFQGGEVSGVAKRDRSGATEHGEVGFTVWQTRPVVIAVDQSDRDRDTTVERSCGNHAVHIAQDFARHARIAATTANPAQFA